MAATTGTTFMTLLESMLTRGNMSGTAMAYYSFYPVSGQTEFIYNDLLPTGQAFLQKVASVHVTNQGGGYGLTEVPNVRFTSNDAGSGASGTAVMQTINDIGVQLRNGLKKAYTMNPTGYIASLIDGSFTNGPSGWENYGGPLAWTGDYHIFDSGKYYVISENELIPNTGALLEVQGPSYFWGSFDVTSGSESLSWFTFYSIITDGYVQGPGTIMLYSGDSQTVLPNGTGTVYFGGYCPAGTIFTPVFYIGVFGMIELDNFNFYVNNVSGIHQEEIYNDTEEALQAIPDSVGNYINIYNGINSAAFGQTRINWMGSNLDGTIPMIQMTRQDNYWWDAYTLSFWHRYSPAYEWNSSFVEVAEWPHFHVQIRNGYYGLYCSYNGIYMPTNIKAQGVYDPHTWHNFIVQVNQLYVPTSTRDVS